MYRHLNQNYLFLYKDFLTIKGVQKRLANGDEIPINSAKDTDKQKLQDTFVAEISDIKDELAEYL